MSKIVQGIGPVGAKIMFVGEAPGEEEDRVGTPFIGSAGQLLRSLADKAGIQMSQCYVTNVVKTRPPRNDISHFLRFDNRGQGVPTAAYMQAEADLMAEIKLINPNVIVALGNVPLWALTRQTSITKRRGSLYRGQTGHKVLACIHPASALREYMHQYYILGDLCRALEESASPTLRLPERKLHIRPTYAEAMQYLERCKAAKSVGHDLEVSRRTRAITCFSFALSPFDAMSIPLTCANGDYFTLPQERDIIRQMAKILEDPAIEIVGQNYIGFDAPYLFRTYGIWPTNVWDTMVAQAILYLDFPKGLDFITSVYTREPYYKDEGKMYMKFGGSEDEFWIYNAKDSAVCMEIKPKQEIELARVGNTETFRAQCGIANQLWFISSHGIRVNVDGLRNASVETKQEIGELRERFAQIAPNVNPASPTQLRTLFYETLGIRPYTNRTTGKVTTNEEALKRIARTPGIGGQAARLVLDIRKLEKLDGTYYEMTFDDDNRLRCSVNPVGTITGRLSTSKTIFGTGGNLQNMTPKFKRFLLADEGYVIYNMDLKQAEDKIVAYIGPIDAKIRVYEQKLDPHIVTAALIFGKPASQISDEKGSSALGNGDQSERDWGKRANHCKFADCEVLTPGGWVTIDVAYQLDAEIAQWDNGIISFVKPNSWFTDIYSGPVVELQNARFYQRGTPEHRMPIVYRRADRGLPDKLIHKTMAAYPRSAHYLAPRAGAYVGGVVSIPPSWIQLLVAFQADGTWNGNTMKFSLTKQRKIERLETILKACGATWTNPSTGVYSVSARDALTALVAATLGRQKQFGAWLLTLDSEGLSTFLAEVVLWDGDQSSEYFSTNEQNALWVQTVAHLCGKAASKWAVDQAATDAYGNKPLHCVNIHNQTLNATSVIERTVSTVQNAQIFCPSVPSGDFLCRENNKISVTGNSLNYNFGAKSFAIKYEMPEREAKMIRDRYIEVYNLEVYWSWVRAELAENDRTLVNPFGRKLKLRERWGHELFKQAYAMIPQSTVADKINRQGLLVIDREPIFRPLVLLDQIHDSLVFELPLSLPFERHAEIILALKRSLETPLRWKAREFVIESDCQIGLNLGKLAKVPITSNDDVEALAATLKHQYQELVEHEAPTRELDRQLPSLH